MPIQRLIGGVLAVAAGIAVVIIVVAGVIAAVGIVASVGAVFGVGVGTLNYGRAIALNVQPERPWLT
ncbi:MAG: hypothetical protein H6721_00005 [Sandaracinus sp.]|nr:hypothetical protein [Sandaracinus sp.]MCB9880156.1 hypothetical protein [Planctomycetota bacterium]